jgi:hypothetical protein
LHRLIGFNPATSNHYGIIQLYNKRIDSSSSDERIIDIRTKFVKWREQILSIFAEKDFYPNTERFNNFFSFDGMFGTLYFLGKPVDIDSGAERYRKHIYDYLKIGENVDETN